MMALSGRVVLYWPEKVLAIYFPAVRGGLRPSKISGGECGGEDEDSAIVAYQATRRDQTNVLVGGEMCVENRILCKNIFSNK